ncbi:hypothetical protein D3C71_1271800 [compost metagenome]
MHTNSVVLGLLRQLHRPENVLVVLCSMEGHAVLPQVQPGRVWLWDYDLWGVYVAVEQLLLVLLVIQPDVACGNMIAVALHSCGFQRHRNIHAICTARKRAFMCSVISIKRSVYRPVRPVSNVYVAGAGVTAAGCVHCFVWRRCCISVLQSAFPFHAHRASSRPFIC